MKHAIKPYKALPGRPPVLKGRKPDLISRVREFYYPRVDFYVSGDDLYFFMRAAPRTTLKSVWLVLPDYAGYTARQVVSTGWLFGEPFRNGVLKLWKQLGLPLGWVPRITRKPKGDK